jgi:hypothetical protein
MKILMRVKADALIEATSRRRKLFYIALRRFQRRYVTYLQVAGHMIESLRTEFCLYLYAHDFDHVGQRMLDYTYSIEMSSGDASAAPWNMIRLKIGE